jgi:nucleotide-binding universal stress UspA family protein
MPDLTVLVPLDGSRPAELAISFLRALTPLATLHVRLLSVAEVQGSVSPEEEKRREKEVADYLESVGDRTEAAYGLKVECIRRTGVPLDEILDESSRPDVNLIVMTTHGRSMAEPERLGSVADKVVRRASCPTLLVGPHASVPLQVQQITVPLDGSRLAAEALPVARAFAEQLGSRLRLVRAVQYPASIESDSIGSLAGDVVQSLDLTASLYLSEARLELETAGTVETALLSGPPAEAILTDLKENAPDLVIMTSHGHSGFVRWALGSVTDRIIRGPVPVLVLRPVDSGADRLAVLTSAHRT